MSDLTTSYLGFSLKNPLVCSASPLCEEIDNIRRMEDSGASAVVLHSLFEEQIVRDSQSVDRFLSVGESYAEALDFFPDMQSYNLGPDGYLDHIRRAKDAVQIPIIASLNGITPGGWTKYAKNMASAGADALELNIYDIPVNPFVTSIELENNYCELVRMVRDSVQIPIAVKLHPYITSLSHQAQGLVREGAAALVLFNRFYQPDFDLENLEVVPHLVLSTSQELLLRIHWVAILYGQVQADLAVTGGIHTAEDVLKAMMAGANVAMMTSALLKNGIGHLVHVLRDLEEWMAEHEYESIRQMQGSMSRKSSGNPPAFERVNYMKVISSYEV